MIVSTVPTSSPVAGLKDSSCPIGGDSMAGAGAPRFSRRRALRPRVSRAVTAPYAGALRGRRERRVSGSAAVADPRRKRAEPLARLPAAAGSCSMGLRTRRACRRLQPLARARPRSRGRSARRSARPATSSGSSGWSETPPGSSCGVLVALAAAERLRARVVRVAQVVGRQLRAVLADVGRCAARDRGSERVRLRRQRQVDGRLGEVERALGQADAVDGLRRRRSRPRAPAGRRCRCPRRRGSPSAGR